jgi:hypothetical protein
VNVELIATDIGGLGTTTKPELLKVDGIYGKRSEMALAKALGGLR